ncbi:MAG: hypothetical protein AB8F34_13915, partial [Akkermansiaceae bacterium]
MPEESPQPDQETSSIDKKSAPDSADVKSQDSSSPSNVSEQGASSDGSSVQKKSTKKSAKKAAKKSTPRDKSKRGDSANKDKSAKDEKQSGDEQQGRQQPRRGRTRGRGRQQQDQPHEPKVKLDRKKVTERAWKIFLGEVNEEGLALIADKDARELARRSLRVAELYSLEEAMILKKAKSDKKRSA